MDRYFGKTLRIDIFGKPLQIDLFGKPYGERFWENPMYRSFGKTLWRDVLGKPFGQFLWAKNYGYTFFIQSWPQLFHPEQLISFVHFSGCKLQDFESYNLIGCPHFHVNKFLVSSNKYLSLSVSVSPSPSPSLSPYPFLILLFLRHSLNAERFSPAFWFSGLHWCFDPQCI